RGGTTNNAYTLSIGYDKNINELYNQFNKLNIRIENTYRPIKNLQATVGVYYTNGKSISGRPSYNTILVNSRQPTYLRFADVNGNPLPVDINLRGIYTDTAGVGKLLSWKYYPLDDYKHDVTTTKNEEIYTTMGLNYK